MRGYCEVKPLDVHSIVTWQTLSALSLSVWLAMNKKSQIITQLSSTTVLDSIAWIAAAKWKKLCQSKFVSSELLNPWSCVQEIHREGKNSIEMTLQSSYKWNNIRVHFCALMHNSVCELWCIFLGIKCRKSHRFTK